MINLIIYIILGLVIANSIRIIWNRNKRVEELEHELIRKKDVFDKNIDLEFKILMYKDQLITLKKRHNKNLVQKNDYKRAKEKYKNRDRQYNELEKLVLNYPDIKLKTINKFFEDEMKKVRTK